VNAEMHVLDARSEPVSPSRLRSRTSELGSGPAGELRCAQWQIPTRSQPLLELAKRR